jgi:hypothetical protein
MNMTSTLPGADIRGYYRALGVLLPESATIEASVRCFADPGAHAREDRDPSCSVNLETGAWRCWGCGASGGAYDAAIALGHTPASAMDLLIDHGLAERRPRSQGSARRPPRPPRPAPTHTPAPKPPPTRLSVGEAEIARWKRALITQPWPVSQLRDEQRRLWQRQTADELDLGWDRGRVIIPIRDAAGGVQGVLRYAPRRTRAPKMLAMTGTRLGLIPRPDQHPADWYVLAEGPPDMITGRSRGLPVIAIPGDHAWDPSWADQFAGQRVTVVMDCDRKGREAAARIAADLKATVAAIAIADLDPNREDGYDLTDWLDQNRQLSARALHALFEP